MAAARAVRCAVPAPTALRAAEAAAHPLPLVARTLPGELYDTGRGYPALRLGNGHGAPGVVGVADWVVELRSPATAALSAMDDYEGTEYQRVLVTLPDGVECWTYVWIDGFDGMRQLEVW